MVARKKTCLTYASLHSLMCIGTSIVYNSPSLLGIMLADYVNFNYLQWKGNNIKLSDLQDACKKLHVLSITSLELPLAAVEVLMSKV